MCFRLLVANKCFKSFLSIIKPFRDISFLHIMFCCQFPCMSYAKYTKNWVLFFGIVKPGKVLEPRGLTTAFFLSKLFHWKRIIRTRLTLNWNALIVFVCAFFLIYVYCSWGLNIGFSSLRRRRFFYSRQRRWIFGRQRTETVCNWLRHIFVILCQWRIWGGASALFCPLIRFKIRTLLKVFYNFKKFLHEFLK